MSKLISHRDKWRIRYQDQRCSAVFDTYKEAKEKLIENNQRTNSIKRSGGKCLLEGKTLHDLCDYWLLHKSPLKRSGKADESMIKNHLRPFFGVVKLRELTVKKIDQYKGVIPSDRIFQEILHRVLARAGLTKLTKSDDATRHYMRFHDLRHTFASHWVMNNGDMFKLQKILGHQSIQMTMRYAHLNPNAFKDDLNRLSFGASQNTQILSLPTGKKL